VKDEREFETPKAIMAIFSKPSSEVAEPEFRRWYTEKHLRDLTNVNGVVSATLYKLDKNIEASPGAGQDPRSYLAIYELESSTPDELAAFTQALQKAVSAGAFDVGPTLDVTEISANFALPVRA
jgi:hypothetical protein